MSTQYQGEFPVSAAMTVRWEYAQPTLTAPTIYDYSSPSLTEGACKLTLYRYTPTSVTKLLGGSTATISGTIHSWVSCTKSVTPDAAGEHVGIFAWMLGGVTAYGVVHFYVQPATYSPSSDGDGRIIGLHYFPHPQVRYVIYQTLGGELVAKQNPA